MDTDMEELPYIVWYQCRMCTHLFFDDIDKMFMHFDKKHGAMIDCEELKSIVFKNGLAMGGLSRSPTITSDGSDVKNELDCSLSNETVNDEDLDLCKLTSPASGPVVLPKSELHDEELGPVYDDEFDIGDTSLNYPAVDVEIDDEAQTFNLNEREQEFEEGGEFSLNNGNEGEVQLDINDDEDENDSHHPLPPVPEVLVQFDDDDDDIDDDVDVYGQNEENGDGYVDDEGEGGEDEFSVGGDHFEDGQYDEMGEDEEDGELENGEIRDMIGMYSSNDSHQKPATTILNYGYSCKFCGKFFTTRRGVESHEQHHKNQSFPTQTIKRSGEPRVYPCKICKSKSFSSFKELKMHVKSHTPERIHICKFCFSTFNNTASLTKHLTIHKRENPNKCFCGKTFVSANTLKIHKKIHTGVKPFVCNFYQCGRAFVTKSTLESHLRTHTGEKPYQCSVCTSSFTTSSAKYRHERHVHKIMDNGALA